MATVKQRLTATRPPPVHHSLQPCNLTNCTKREMREYFENSFDLNEVIFTGITDDQHLYKCPDRLRLPLIFYLAHPAALYVNKLLLAGVISNRVSLEFETMFETGVNEMWWDDTENYRMGGTYKWPSVEDIMAYRKQVRELVVKVIETTPLSLPVTSDHYLWALFLGMEHERAHMETSTVLLRQLPVEYLQRPKGWKYGPVTASTAVGPNTFIKVPAGKVVIGKPKEFPSYGWDNEYGSADIDVPEFEATKYLITNSEFAEFVKDGGYQRKELWTREGWIWLQFRQAKHPTFWVCADGCKSGCGAELTSYSHCKESVSIWRYRAVYDVIDMPWAWPVEVNYHEAKAFCFWKGAPCRMPTEAEHHRIRGENPPSLDPGCDPSFHRDYPANINFKYGSPTPVNLYPPTSLGFHDVYGNVWEWVEDHFNGLPGFKPDYLYSDYSTPYFDGRHTLVMGSSWVSSGTTASRFVRFAFRRHFFQHAGFRVVKSSNYTPARMCNAKVFILGAGVPEIPVATPNLDSKCFFETMNSEFQYESEQSLHSILEHQFEENASVQLVTVVEEVLSKYNGKKSSAINLGCGPGHSSFLLASTFSKVLGVDYCGRFIDAAIRLSDGEAVSYTSNGVEKVAKIPAAMDTSKILFKQFNWIPNEVVGYDVAVVEFLDRLGEARGWLCKLWECVAAGALVIFATSPSSQWTMANMQKHIGKWFTLLEKGVLRDGRITSVWRLKD